TTGGGGVGGGVTATAGARGGRFKEYTATPTINPVTSSRPMMRTVPLLRGVGAATVPGPRPMVLATDIRRGAAPGAGCVPPGRFNICITSELTGRGGACVPLAPAPPTPFVFWTLACGIMCGIGAGVSSNDDGSPVPASCAPRAASAG